MHQLLGLSGAALAAFLLTSFLTWLAIRYAVRTKLLDIPNERSAHKAATPRGGGIGFVVTITVFFATLGVLQELSLGFDSSLPPYTFVAFAVAGALTAAVGWLDDRYSLPAAKRLVTHFLSAAISVAPFYPMSSGGVQLAVGIFLLAGLINFYNFMDGIDGIAGVEALTASLTLAGVSYYFKSEVLLIAYVIVAAASLGFLIFNWPPAKIFMGDVGSGYLGLIFGILAAAGAAEFGLRAVAVTLIALGVFIVDATYTLIDRARKGQKVWQAHSEHAYQHSARRWGHKPVTQVTLLVNVFWLAPIAALAAFWFDNVLVAIAVAYLPLVIATFLLKRPVPVRGLA